MPYCEDHGKYDEAFHGDCPICAEEILRGLRPPRGKTPMGKCDIHGFYYAKFQGIYDGCPMCAKEKYGRTPDSKASSTPSAFRRTRNPVIRGIKLGLIGGFLIGFVRCTHWHSSLSIEALTGMIGWLIVGAVLGGVLGKAYVLYKGQSAPSSPDRKPNPIIRGIKIGLIGGFLIAFLGFACAPPFRDSGRMLIGAVGWIILGPIIGGIIGLIVKKWR